MISEREAFRILTRTVVRGMQFKKRKPMRPAVLDWHPAIPWALANPERRQALVQWLGAKPHKQQHDPEFCALFPELVKIWPLSGRGS